MAKQERFPILCDEPFLSLWYVKGTDRDKVLLAEAERIVREVDHENLRIDPDGLQGQCHPVASITVQIKEGRRWETYLTLTIPMTY